MSLRTHSRFVYGFEVSEDALYIDFSEGDGELTAELAIGNYTLTSFAVELSRALNAAGELTYTVTVDRETRKITISASGTFSLLTASGSHIGTSAFAVAGFTGANRTGAASYEGAAAGSEYRTQFILQSYVSPDDFQDAVYGTVNVAASGLVEVAAFGRARFVEMDIQYANDYNHGDDTVIRTDAGGVAKLQAFIQYLTSRAPLEFEPDEDTPATFLSLTLENTPDDQKGLRYKLREQYTRNLPGYFNTGVLRFRVNE